MSLTKFSIKILIHFSLLFFYLILNIYCGDCDNCKNNGIACIDLGIGQTCDSKCKPKYGGGESDCYYCDSANNLYTISDGTCQNSCTGNYILDWSKECISSEPSTGFKMGNYYYQACPGNSRLKPSNNNECECEYKYYIEVNDNRKEYKCLSPTENCPSGRYLNPKNNFCYEAANCNFIKDVISTTDKLCLSTCDYGEGYIFEDDSPTQPKKCLDSCTSPKQYYNHGENKCIQSCSITNNNKLYHKQDDYECFYSCKDIEGGEFIYTKQNDYNCYSSSILSETSCTYYFPLSNGVKRCVAGEDDCLNSNHIYLKGKECIEECDYYKAIDNSVSPSTALKKCFLELNECFKSGNEYYYYNLKEKICWKENPPNYCINKNNQAFSNAYEVMPITENYYIDEGKTYCCTICPRDHYSYRKINSNQCISTCTGSGNEYHIAGDNICYESCKDIPSGPNGKYLYEIQRPLVGSPTEKICSDIIPNDCPFYYLSTDDIKICTTSCSSPSPSYEFQKGKECLSLCNGFTAINNPGNEETTTTTKECFEELNGCFSGTTKYNYYDTITQTCWTKLPDSYYIKSINGEKKEVVKEADGCGSDLLQYEVSGNPKKCITFEECKNLGKIKNGNSCVNEDACSTFIENSKCVSTCGTETDLLYHNNDSKQCIFECSGYYPYHKENDKTCYHSYTDFVSNGFKYLKGNIISQTVCSNFYKKEVLDATNYISICFETEGDCIQEGLKYVKENKECVSECEPTDYKIEPETNSNGKITVLGKCISDQADCENVGYYYEDEKICRRTPCPLLSSTNEHICVTGCDSNQKVEENKCVNDCTDTDKFFVEEKIEIRGIQRAIKKCIHKKCQEYSNDYGIIYYSQNGKECLKSCHEGFYKIGNSCYKNCEGTDKFFNPSDKSCSGNSLGCPNDYYEKLSNYPDADIYICKSSCESQKFTHKDGNGKIECLSKCPLGSDYEYHEKNSKECIAPFDCSSGIADFESKECVARCETDYFRLINNGLTGAEKKTAKICLNNCDDNEYITPDNKCIQDCSDGGFVIHSTEEKKCICEKLYYFDDTEKVTKCINNIINKCYENSGDYKIELYGSYRCLNRCFNILSLNGEICYETERSACQSDLDRNSKIKIVNNVKKCECPFKFYIDNNNKKHCLEELEECSEPYKYYIPETKQCVSNCNDTNDFKKIFKIFCLRRCPSKSIESEGKCLCGNNDENLWYSTGEASFSCLNEEDLCPHNYKAYAPQTHQCLEKCKGSYYPYLYDENQCYSGCGYIPSTLSIDINNDLAIKSCVCKKPWYFSFLPGGKKKTVCPAESDSINDCLDHKLSDVGFNKLFMIHDTKECVEECPSKYPYIFNHECFTDCERHAKQKYYNVVEKGSYECQCKYLWHYINDAKKIKECFDENKKLCIKSIPNKPYLIYDTNECVDACPDGTKVFNMTCYNKCPEFTLDISDSETGYTCSCNKDIDSYWYQYEDEETLPDGETHVIYYGCGIKECPDIRPNLLKAKKQCLLDCNIDDNEFKFNLRHICNESCPEFTDDDNPEKICKFIDLNNEAKVKDKESLKNYANVQAKELYESRFTYNDGNHIGGYLFNKFEDVSLQIYAIDKYDTLKEYSTKSNLTYIDLDTCLPKIFMDNSIRETDKIIVAKYDLNYWNIDTENSGSSADSSENKDKEKHIINKVEYELYNSRTMERIDASVCDPYEILISYPIVFNKNRYNNYESGFNDNEYKKKFDIGKKLHLKDNELDTFNSNDTLYKDLCLGIEIDGKDLVLEDRYQFLYPNGAVLCESNCTFNSTDFDEERINCKCSYKEEIDFKRVENEKNDLLNDPNFKLPEQSGANLEVIKCLGKLSFKKSIKKNEAFYYCAAVTVVVISMTLVTAFYGLKAVSSNIKGIYNKLGNKNGENINNLEETKLNNKNEINKNDNNLSTSHRILSAPPKKNMNNNNEDEDRNIIDNKDIGMIYNINQSKNEDENIENINNENIIDDSFKAEYLPPQYNFKFFKLNDKGIRKQIERAKLPFKVNPDVKYLLERKKEITYPENYLKGPFYSNQNIIEIIDKNNDEPNSNNNNNFGNSKEVKYIRNNNNDNNSQIKLINDKESPQKRNLKNNLNFNMNMKNENKKEKEKEKEKKELDFISIKKITFNKKNNNEGQDNEEEISEKKDENVGLYTLIKREQALLRVSYNKYVMKDHSNILSVFLAEILDKVYLVKICLFLKKFEIFGVHFSLYLFCHLLLLTLSCAFFTISTIKKIWNEDKYPGMSYYLLYGIITNIVVWVVYRVFLCLLDIQDNVKELMKNDNKDKSENIDENKFNEIMKKLKCRIIIFYCIIYVFIIIFALYLISFFAIYTGTKSSVLEAYIIGIIEILLIKLVYGICLASLRIASEGNELKSLYKLVYLLDKYVS